MKRLGLLLLTVLLLMLSISPAMADNKFYFDKEYNTVFEDETLQLVLIREGNCAIDGELKFTSSNRNVMTVDEEGVVTGVAKGEATIKATLKNEKGSYQASLKVTCARKVTGIEVNTSKLTVLEADDPLLMGVVDPDPAYSELPVLILRKGTTRELSATMTPSTASNRRWEITAANPDLVRISGSSMYGKEPGECIITVSSVQNPEVYQELRLLVCEPVTKVNVTGDTKILYLGESTMLTAELSPQNATLQGVRWSTNAPKCVSVDEYGVVTALAKGEATITAKAADGSGKADTYTIVVRQPPESLSLNKETLELSAGKYATLTPTVLPSNTSDKSVNWYTSDESVAKVSSGGRVTAMGPGVAIITCESKTHAEVYAQCVVTVIQPVTRIAFLTKNPIVYVGESLALSWEVGPEDATDSSVTLSLSKTGIVELGQDGVIHGLKRGEVYVYAKANDGSGKKATATVTVRQPPESLALNKDVFSLAVGKYSTLKATVLPSTTNDKSVNWYSSDESVAKVNSSGRVTAVSVGTAIITCESKTHPDVSSQAVVNVYQPVTKISFMEKNPYVAVGESIQVSWEVSPMTATDSSVTLSTNKTSILEVRQDGTIIGLKRGEAYVYATANDGSEVRGSIKVTVTQPVEGVGIKYDEVSVDVGKTVTNTAVFQPSDASITRMTWYSQDETIATVTGSGSKATVTGRGWGETTIIGVTEDGNYVTTFTVSVGNLDQPLKIVNLYVEESDTIRIVTYNQSNLVITRFYYEIELFDAWGNPLDCNDRNHSNMFEGMNKNTIYPGESLGRGTYTFGSEFSRPWGIGKVVMTITGYETEDGTSRYIRQENREEATWQATVLDGYNY